MRGLRNLLKDIADIILDPGSGRSNGAAPPGHELAKRYLPMLQVSELSGTVVVIFICQGCKVPMPWDGMEEQWACGSCGSSLKPPYAVALLDHVEEGVRRMKRAVADLPANTDTKDK